MITTLRAKYMGSANCVATRLLARRFCEPRRALRTSTKGNRVHEATTEDCTKGSAKAQAPPTNPQGLHDGLRESQAPARTHANSKLLATQSGDPFCFALTHTKYILYDIYRLPYAIRYIPCNTIDWAPLWRCQAAVPNGIVETGELLLLGQHTVLLAPRQLPSTSRPGTCGPAQRAQAGFIKEYTLN